MGNGGSIRKTLQCKESGALKARSEKRYGAKNEGHSGLSDKLEGFTRTRLLTHKP